MKIRLAKKIMRHNTPYWVFRYLCYYHLLLPGAGYKVDFKDHRIIKAISLTSKRRKTMKKETFDFSEALRRMKEGKKVRRSEWDKGLYIYFVAKKSLLYLIDESEKLKIWYNTFGGFFSTEDVFATDWEEVVQ